LVFSPGSKKKKKRQKRQRSKNQSGWLFVSSFMKTADSLRFVEITGMEDYLILKNFQTKPNQANSFFLDSAIF